MLFYYLYGNELIDLEKIYRIGYYKVSIDHFSAEEIRQHRLPANAGNQKFGKLIIFFDANQEHVVVRVFNNIEDGLRKFEEISGLLLKKHTSNSARSTNNPNDSLGYDSRNEGSSNSSDNPDDIIFK